MRPVTPQVKWTNTMTKATKHGKGKITITLKGPLGKLIQPHLDHLWAAKKK